VSENLIKLKRTHSTVGSSNWLMKLTQQGPRGGLNLSSICQQVSRVENQVSQATQLLPRRYQLSHQVIHRLSRITRIEWKTAEIGFTYQQWTSSDPTEYSVATTKWSRQPNKVRAKSKAVNCPNSSGQLQNNRNRQKARNSVSKESRQPSSSPRKLCRSKQMLNIHIGGWHLSPWGEARLVYRPQSLSSV
jgi:hypothetical protein